MKTITPFIFCAGKGTRLKPLTNTTPKPLLPVGDSSMLEINLERLVSKGFTKIYASFSYRKDLFEEVTKKFKNKAEITLVEDKKVSGQASTLRDNIDLFGEDEVLLGLNGDTFIDFDLNTALNNLPHQKATVFGSPDVRDLPKELLCEENKLKGARLNEKDYLYTETAATLKRKNNIGMHVLPVELIKCAEDTKGFLGFFGERDLFDIAIKEGKTVYYKDIPVQEFWTFNTPEEYNKVKSNFLDL